MPEEESLQASSEKGVDETYWGRLFHRLSYNADMDNIITVVYYVDPLTPYNSLGLLAHDVLAYKAAPLNGIENIQSYFERKY